MVVLKKVNFVLVMKKGNRIVSFSLGGLRNNKTSFSTRKAAEKQAKFLRQIDDDLPIRKRRKSFKNIRVQKV